MERPHEHENNEDDGKGRDEYSVLLPVLRSKDSSVVEVYVIRTEIIIMSCVAIVVRATAPTPLMLANSTSHVAASFVLFHLQSALRTVSDILLISQF